MATCSDNIDFFAINVWVNFSHKSILWAEDQNGLLIELHSECVNKNLLLAWAVLIWDCYSPLWLELYLIPNNVSANMLR